MNWTEYLFAEAKSPDILQVVLRGLLTFTSALIIFRVGARRTFGKGTAVDNLVIIVLGGMLSRVITGAAAYLPVIAATIGIILFQRLIAALCLHPQLSSIIMGRKLVIYKNGIFNQRHLQRSMMSMDDVNEAVRLRTNSDDFTTISAIYIERNGQISVVKK